MFTTSALFLSFNDQFKSFTLTLTFCLYSCPLSFINVLPFLSPFYLITYSWFILHHHSYSMWIIRADWLQQRLCCIHTKTLHDSHEKGKIQAQLGCYCRGKSCMCNTHVLFIHIFPHHIEWSGSFFVRWILLNLFIFQQSMRWECMCSNDFPIVTKPFDNQEKKCKIF